MVGNVFDNVSSAEEFERAFAIVMADASPHADCRKTWRLAASLDRGDVLLALLDQPLRLDMVKHARKWAAPGVCVLLDAFLDAQALMSTTASPSSSETVSRL